MSGTLGNLNVVLSLDSTGFTYGMGSAQGASAKTDAAVNKLYEDITRLHSRMGETASFTRWAAGAIAATAALEGVRSAAQGLFHQMLETNNEIQKTTNLLQGMSSAATTAGRANDAADQYRYILDMASKAPFSLQALTDTFVKLKTGGIDPTKGAMQGLVDAVAAFGGDDQRLLRAGYALQEMAGRGVLSLSNLRRQLGQDIPGAERVMAEALGVNLQSLFKMVESGTVDSVSSIQRMTDQMERLYGGAAQNMMNSYQGRLQQIKTTLIELSQVAMGNPIAQQATPGNRELPSAYGAMTNNLGRINSALQGSEASEGAVDLNNALVKLANTVGGLTEFAIRHEKAIRLVTEAVLTATAGYVGLKVAVAAVDFIGPLANMTRWRALGGQVADLTLKFVALKDILPAIGTTVIEWGAGMEAGALATTAAAGGVAAFGGALGAAAVGLGVVTVGIGALAGTVAVIYMVGKAFYNAWENSRRFSASVNDIHEGMDRLRQGAFGEDSTGLATKELSADRQRADMAANLRRDLRDIQSHTATRDEYDQARQIFQQRRIGGIDGGKGIDFGRAANDFNNGGADMYSARMNDLIKQLDDYDARAQDIIKKDTDLVGNATAKQVSAATQKQFDQMQNDAQTSINNIRQHAIQSFNEIDAKRKALPVGDQRAANAELSQQAVKIATSESDQVISVYQRMYDAILNLQKKHLAAKQDDQVRSDNQRLAQIKEQIDRERVLRDNAGDLALPPDRGQAENAYGKQERNAESQLQTMESRMSIVTARFGDTLANLANGDSAGGISVMLAKVNDELSKTGRLNLIGLKDAAGNFTELATNMRNAATAIDEFGSKQNQLNAIVNTQERVASALARQSDSIAESMYKLSNPNAGQADVSEFMRRRDATKNVTLSQNLVDQLSNDPKATDADRSNAQTALTRAKLELNMFNQQQAVERDLANGTKAQEETQRARLAGLSGRQRFEEQKRQDLTRINTQLNQSLETLKTLRVGSEEYDAETKAIANLRGAASEVNARTDRQEGAAAAKAARPADNFATQIREHMDTLRASISGVDAQEARFQARLAEDSALKGHKDQLSGLIQQYSELSAAVKSISPAVKGLTEIHLTNNSATTIAEAARRVSNMNETDFGSKVGAATTKINVQVNQLREALKDPIFQKDPQALKFFQSLIDGSQNMMGQSTTNMLNAQITAQADEMRRSRDGLRMNGGDGSKRYYEQMAAEERSALNTSIQTGQTKEKDRAAIEDNIAAYAKMKIQEVERANQSSTMKMMGEWQNLNAGLDNLAKQGLSGLADQLTLVATNGTTSWSKFGNSILSMIDQIVLKFAMSGVLDMVGQLMGQNSVTQGANNSSNGGWANILGGLFKGAAGGITKMFGGGGGSGGSGAIQWGGVYHTGGIVGSEPTNTRMFDPAIFSNAMRYHTGGLAGDEVPAILQKGEGVFTKGQMSAIGNMRSAIASIPSQVGQAVSANYAFGDKTPNIASQNNGTSGSLPPVTVNLHNQTGQDHNAQAAQPRFDGEKMIIDVVTKAASRPGGLRSAIKGAS